MRSARRRVDGLPPEFRFHALRHYFASLLIAAGCDIKTVQARVRHGSAKTTLDTHSAGAVEHSWGCSDESSCCCRS